MWQTTLTVINLSIAVLTLALGVIKAMAARREPGLNLALTASVLLLAGVIFLLATPPIYRAVGSAVHSPNLPALCIDIATLLCVGHAHYMTLLWHPERHTATKRRHALKVWLPFYAAAVTVMVILYACADLSETARPLHFAPAYAHVPAVFALKSVYFAALITTVIATMVQCRQVALPGRPDLAEDLQTCMRWFAIAVGLDLATVGFTLSAMISAVARGDQRLDTLADASWVATIASGIAANWGLGRLALAATRDDRRDIRILKPLWRLVVTDAPQLVIPTGPLNSRVRLDRMMLEILDGARTLKPWMSSGPARAVEQLVGEEQTRASGRSPAADTPIDLVAAQTSATLLYAAARRADTEQSPPAPAYRLMALPGLNVPASDQRAYLVRVAQYLNARPRPRRSLFLRRQQPDATHPIVAKALQLGHQATMAG
jgi:hypothetical protein